MKVNIISKERNPLMKRKEIIFSVEHAQNGGTPSRVEISKKLAILLKKDVKLIYIKNIKTKTGTTLAFGEVNVYDTIEQARSLEPKHIITRSAFPEKNDEPNGLKEQIEEKERKKIDV